LIRKIENVAHLKNLVSVNLGDNFIEKIENLEENTQLETLVLKRNQIGVNGIDDLQGLTKLKSLR
jgi:Leucine-rich repeat (LRR) protein